MEIRQPGNGTLPLGHLLLGRVLRILWPGSLHSEDLHLPDLAAGKRSLFIRHLDCGSCNGCEMELNALNNPVYDIQRFGIRFEASPRHADLLAMTGPFTRNLEQAARLTLEAMPGKIIVAVGDCAVHGGVFRDSYAVMATRPDDIEDAIKVRIEGCPPSPLDILKALAGLPADLAI